MVMRSLSLIAWMMVSAFTGVTWAAPLFEEEQPSDSAAYCMAPLDWYGSEELDPAGIDQQLQEGSWFWDLSAYKVGIDFDDKSVDCDDSCRQSITGSVARALNLWRQVCVTCAPGLMTAVSIDSSIFMDLRFFTVMKRAHEETLSKIEEAFYAAALQDDLPELADRNLSVVPYVKIMPSHPIVLEICEIPEPVPSSLARAIRSGICQPQPNKTSIRFTDDFPCGLENAVACGNPEGRIDFWTREIGYYETDFDGTRRFVLGKPDALEDDQVDLVYLLAHEFGHVLGLGHIQFQNRPGDLPAVMLEKLQSSFCITIAETMMISSAAARVYPYRAKTGMGLYRRGYEPKR